MTLLPADRAAEIIKAMKEKTREAVEGKPPPQPLKKKRKSEGRRRRLSGGHPPQILKRRLGRRTSLKDEPQPPVAEPPTRFKPTGRNTDLNQHSNRSAWMLCPIVPSKLFGEKLIFTNTAISGGFE